MPLQRRPTLDVALAGGKRNDSGRAFVPLQDSGRELSLPERIMQGDLHGEWSEAQISHLVAELARWEEHLPPYLMGFLETVAHLEPGDGLRPAEIEKVKAAWEYDDEQQEEWGFLVGLSDGRAAYLEGRRIRITGQTVVAVRQVGAEAGFRDVGASPAAGAGGWVEYPDEVNFFLERMAGVALPAAKGAR
jgi:hypothetical protein